jgi:hypothetical protein
MATKSMTKQTTTQTSKQHLATKLVVKDAAVMKPIQDLLAAKAMATAAHDAAMATASAAHDAAMTLIDRLIAKAILKKEATKKKVAAEKDDLRAYKQRGSQEARAKETTKRAPSRAIPGKNTPWQCAFERCNSQFFHHSSRITHYQRVHGKTREWCESKPHKTSPFKHVDRKQLKHRLKIDTDYAYLKDPKQKAERRKNKTPKE